LELPRSLPYQQVDAATEVQILFPSPRRQRMCLPRERRLRPALISADRKLSEVLVNCQLREATGPRTGRGSRQLFGVRWQSEAATPLWAALERGRAGRESGV